MPVSTSHLKREARGFAWHGSSGVTPEKGLRRLFAKFARSFG